MKCEKHEFNTGFVSALAKFLAHQMERFPSECDHRIYGATDHLFDIEIPKNLPEDLRNDIIRFVNNAMRKRLLTLKAEEADELFDEADNLLQRIDREIFKLEHVCSNYP